ncbi:hypothetical protein SAMN05216223_12683 [Actinacidiphila yanglinensis]|uniref:Uncharacterized protein n=1 Tax=Actinacidiphila yanglinensis TaxID=310779 RepID=A0A1H6E647_9ACTN|nr:hypothetical protein [Actinacidiphila yanglinensis]SEG92741.1 hypothetical protein SAMN05216223_12683 [Actinacidiphila yanglinensis]
MLSLRLLRGARPAALARWALVALASWGTGLLLLAALGWALAHPKGGASDAVVRLGWCVVPVVVTVQLAVAVGRAQPGAWPRPGLAAVGLGRTGVVLLAAATATLVCAFGSALALVTFLQLRGDITGVPYHGVGPGLLATGRSLPAAGAVTLLALVPVATGAASAARLRTGGEAADGVPGGLPWGVALVATGLAIEVTAPDGHTLALPSGMGAIAPAAVGGWVLTAAGLVLAGPGLVHGCGRLLAAFRPGGLRLLSGRGLQHEARRLGRPLGLLSATSAAALSGYGLQQHTGRTLGPVTTFAATLVAVCVLASAAVAAVESRSARMPSNTALRELAAPASLLRASAAIRVGILVVAFLAPTLLVAALSPRP